MRVIIDFARRGGQVRPYGPNVYDFTVTIESPYGEPYQSVFDTWARKVIDWRPHDEAGWWEWRDTYIGKTGPHQYRYIIEQPYDD